ncbi:hypothetical protein [Streptomyces sp. NPDC048392]|uniref:hypothetical protein n=1 Tax=Streptomyces sp. NPDC048392 TaxID=3365543 RepID=UPI0037150BA8
MPSPPRPTRSAAGKDGGLRGLPLPVHAELLPALIRALGCRVGGAIGTVFVTPAVVAVAGSLSAAAWAPETSGRALEDVAPWGERSPRRGQGRDSVLRKLV